MLHPKYCKQAPKQWWQAVAGIAAGLLSNKMSNDQSESNTAMSYANSRLMRQTSYQDTVQDLRLAGLNPMLAYTNGATPATAQPVAQNKPLMENVANSAAAFEQAKNAQAQRELLEAQAEKTRAETEAIPSSVANIQEQTRNTAQQTENLQQTIPKIQQEIANLKTQNLTERERTALTLQQNRLTQIDQDLRKKQIDSTEAATRTQNVITQLKNLEVPGAKNAAQWEESLGQYSKEAGAAGTAARAAGVLINSTRKVLGK